MRIFAHFLDSRGKLPFLPPRYLNDKLILQLLAEKVTKITKTPANQPRNATAPRTGQDHQRLGQHQRQEKPPPRGPDRAPPPRARTRASRKHRPPEDRTERYGPGPVNCPDRTDPTPLPNPDTGGKNRCDPRPAPTPAETTAPRTRPGRTPTQRGRHTASRKRPPTAGTEPGQGKGRARQGKRLDRHRPQTRAPTVAPAQPWKARTGEANPCPRTRRNTLTDMLAQAFLGQHAQRRANNRDDAPRRARTLVTLTAPGSTSALEISPGPLKLR